MDKRKHPSGRPVRRPEKRDYSMMAHRREDFVCPRLNDTIRPRHDTYAVGFMSGHEPRDDLHWYTEARK